MFYLRNSTHCIKATSLALAAVKRLINIPFQAIVLTAISLSLLTIGSYRPPAFAQANATTVSKNTLDPGESTRFQSLAFNDLLLKPFTGTASVGGTEVTAHQVAVPSASTCTRETVVPADAEGTTVIWEGAVEGKSYEVTAVGVWRQDPDPTFNTGPDGLTSFIPVFDGPFTGMLFGSMAVLEFGSGTWVKTGSLGTVVATADGDLFGSFADLPGLFSNNFGFMTVTVTESPCVEIEFNFEGRQVMFDKNSNGELLGKATDFIIEIKTPEDGVFEPTKKDDWSSSSVNRIELSEVIGTLHPNRIGMRLRGGAEGGRSIVAVKVTVHSESLGDRTLTVSKPFGNIQLIAEPAANPPAWLPGDPNRDFSVKSIPERVPENYSDLGLSESRSLWEEASDSFDFQGSTDTNRVTIRALKPSRSLAKPDPARYSMSISGTRLEGTVFLGRGRNDVPVLINGCEITATPPPPVCVSEKTSIECAVRAADGKGRIDKPTIADPPTVKGEKLTVNTKHLFFDTPDVVKGAARLKITYESPSHPGHECSTDVNLTVLPVDTIEIDGGDESCIGDKPQKLTGTARCAGKIISGPLIRWRIADGGGTGSQIDPNSGLFTPGLIPGDVTIEAVIQAADKPQYVMKDLVVQKAVTIADLDVEIPEARGQDSFVSCSDITLSAVVTCGHHDITHDPDTDITWPNGGPVFTLPGVYDNVIARATFRGRTKSSKKVRVIITGGPPVHDSGDFSVDEKDEDVEETHKPWVATRYYYSGSLGGHNHVSIEVDRFIPGIDKSGHPTQKSVDNEVISRNARLRLWGYGGEIEFNGKAYGNGRLLEGSNGVFDYDIDIMDLKLPLKRELTIIKNGIHREVTEAARPVPGKNHVLVFGLACSYELSFNAMSPYVMVHGKGADHRYWDGINTMGKKCWNGFTEAFGWDGLTEALRNKKNGGSTLPIPFDNSIDLWSSRKDFKHLPSQGSILDQGSQLDAPLALVVKSFGTSHVNIVAHSKGGLDSRYWLTNKTEPGSPSNSIIVGQFITINTPHLGSVLADYAFPSAKLRARPELMAQLPAVFLNPEMKYPFLTLGGIFAPELAGSPATEALMTSTMGQFNNANLPRLMNYTNLDGTRPTFLATSSDANLDGDSRISLPSGYAVALDEAMNDLPLVLRLLLQFTLKLDLDAPLSPPSADETKQAICWDGTMGYFVTGTIGARTAYEAIANVKSVTWHFPDPSKTGVLKVTEEPVSGKPQPNDFLVTRRSAEFQIPKSSPFIAHEKLFFRHSNNGLDGKMHGNVADSEVARYLVTLQVGSVRVMPPTK